MFSGLAGGQAHVAFPSEGRHGERKVIALDGWDVRVSKQKQPLDFEPPLVRQAHRERDRMNLHGAAQPSFSRDQMLQP